MPNLLPTSLLVWKPAASGVFRGKIDQDGLPSTGFGFKLKAKPLLVAVAHKLAACRHKVCDGQKSKSDKLLGSLGFTRGCFAAGLFLPLKFSAFS